MFQAADILNFSASFSHDTQTVSSETHQKKRTGFDSDEEIGALAHVYSEIARRLSRNAYTRHVGAQ
jgi:hypothetical protein